VWEHPQFTIAIGEKYADGAYKTLKFILHDLPGVFSISAKDEVELSYHHRFYFTLPREYPQNLGKIKIVNETPLFHPRITRVGTTACYVVNGEIDRILLDIIFNILLRPETVKPPTQYKDADWGLNVQIMQRYIQYGPQRIYEFLKCEWAKKQRKKSSQPHSPSQKVKFLG
jgi:hypothetical protein